MQREQDVPKKGNWLFSSSSSRTQEITPQVLLAQAAKEFNTIDYRHIGGCSMMMKMPGKSQSGRPVLSDESQWIWGRLDESRKEKQCFIKYLKP